MATIILSTDSNIDAIVIHQDSTGENIKRRIGSGPWLYLGVSDGSNYVDREAASGVTYQYQVGSGNMASTSISYNRWWIRHLSNPSYDIKDIMVDSDPLTLESNEEHAKFKPLGRKYPVVIKDVIRGEMGSLSVQTMGREEFDRFRDIRSLQTTLLLQSPMSEQWYFVFDTSFRQRIHNTSDEYRHIEFDIVEVERPHHEDL